MTCRWLSLLSVVLLAAICAGAAAAAERPFTGAEIQAALADHTVQGEDGGKVWRQIFHKSGVTYYTVDAAQSQGRWEVRGDQYCSQWPPNEAWSCYEVTGDGSVLVFVSASGKRWPVSVVN